MMKMRALGIFVMFANGLHGQEFWEPVLPSAASVATLAMNSRHEVFAGAWAGGVFRSTDDGRSWDTLNSGLSYPSALSLAVDPTNDDLYASSGQTIHRSTDSGATWETQDSTTFSSGAWKLRVNEQGLLFAAPGSSDSLRRSSDRGKTWTTVHNGLPSGPVQDLQILPGGELYACMKGNWIFCSSNDGDLWTPLPKPIGPQFLDADAISFGAGGEIYVGDDGAGFLRSTDNGTSWDQVNDGLPNTFVWAIAVTGEGTVFAGLARDGIYRSTNRGTDWDSINSGLGLQSRRIYALFVAPDGHLLAGTLYGVYRSREVVTVVRSTSIGISTGYALFQNYPNPFNPTTVISFQLPVVSKVKLVVYDMLGREVAVLTNGRKNAGVHQVTFDASQLASGAYLCSLEAGKFKASRKLLILR
jgi:photosystem II stability/assembly factor-like uncharacterized protein